MADVEKLKRECFAFLYPNGLSGVPHANYTQAYYVMSKVFEFLNAHGFLTAQGEENEMSAAKFMRENPGLAMQKKNINPERDEAVRLLTAIAQMMDVIKQEWGAAWTAWDQCMRDDLTKYICRANDIPYSQFPHLAENDIKHAEFASLRCKIDPLSPPTDDPKVPDDPEIHEHCGYEECCGPVPDELEAIMGKEKPRTSIISVLMSQLDAKDGLSLFYNPEQGWHFSYKGEWYGDHDLEKALRAALEKIVEHD